VRGQRAQLAVAEKTEVRGAGTLQRGDGRDCDIGIALQSSAETLNQLA